MPERATVLSRSEKSAEAGILGGGAGEAEDRRGRAEGIGGCVPRLSGLECLRCSLRRSSPEGRQG